MEMMSKIPFFLLFSSFLFSYNYFGVNGVYSGSISRGIELVGGKKEVNRLYWKFGMYDYKNNTSLSTLSLNFDIFKKNFYLGCGIGETGNEEKDFFSFNLRSGYLLKINNKFNLNFDIEEIFIPKKKNIFAVSVGVEKKVDFDMLKLTPYF